MPDCRDDALQGHPPLRCAGDCRGASTDTLLVIEDEVVLARNIERYLGRHGHRVSVAGDVGDGLRQFASLRPRLVLIDFHLPGGTGLQVLRAMRGADARVRAIIMSGHSSPSVATAVAQAGADAYLPKPIVLERLKQLVDGILRAGSADRRQD